VPNRRREPAVANLASRGDNHGIVKKTPSAQDEALPSIEPTPFSAGALVVVTLGNPRDKFWGQILALLPEGLSISGIELASVDDLTLLVKGGEPFTPAVVFFPMHRIERIALDLPDGDLPSLSQRFEAKTGQPATAALGSNHAKGKNTQAVTKLASGSRSQRGRA
jgi:hypothetical protein